MHFSSFSEFPSSLDYNSLQLATDLQLLFLLQQTNHLQYPHPPPLPESSRSSTCSSPPASLQSSPSTSPSALSTSPTPKFFSDLFLNEKLVQIQVARTALTPPDWSKRQQGHRAGVQRQRYSADKTGKLMQRYNESKYVTREEMEALADETGLSKQQVPFTLFLYRQ